MIKDSPHGNPMDIDGIYSEIRNAAIGGIEKIDGAQQWHSTAWTAGLGTFDVAVFRGAALEKVSIARICLDVKRAVDGSSGALDLVRLDGLQVNIYPANPLLPVALINLERRQLASGIRLGGYLSIFPMNEKKEINGAGEQAVSLIAQAAEAGSDRTLMECDTIWRDLDWQPGGKKCLGIRISGDDRGLGTLKHAAISVLNAVLGSISANKDIPYSPEDENKMFSFRFKLSEFILIKDASTRICLAGGVKLETIAAMILPPVVRF